MKTFWYILLAVVLSAAIFGGGTYYYSKKRCNTDKDQYKNQIAELERRLTAISTATATPKPTATATKSTKSDEELIKEAFTKSHSGTSFDITVSKISGNYAQGGAVETGSEVGGGWFLAAKKNGEWVIVDEGNGTVSCEKIEGYNFPTDMVPECWSESQNKLITR